MKRNLILFVLLAAAVPAVALAQNGRSYAGQDSRPVKALSPEEIGGYLAGEGLGMAKAAELNHYPGPKHALALAAQLSLTSNQKRQLESISAGMNSAAVPLGRQIVGAERALDRDFANATVDDIGLKRATMHIAELEGRLRTSHLSAHLATRRVLTTEQVAIYDRERGYDDAVRDSTHHHGM